MMDPPVTKFKTRKSWNEFGHSHALTFSTYHKHRYLSDDRICRLLAKAINRAADEHHFAVLAFVFMPDHVHLLIHPLEEVYDMSTILQAIKQGPSRTAKSRGWIPTVLWEPGGGYDSNITHSRERLNAIRYIHQNPVRKELVGDAAEFRWSSARWYFTDEACDIQCVHVGELWE